MFSDFRFVLVKSVDVELVGFVEVELVCSLDVELVDSVDVELVSEEVVGSTEVFSSSVGPDSKISIVLEKWKSCKMLPQPLSINLRIVVSLMQAGV